MDKRKNHWAITHDKCKTPEYNIWRQMRQRCQNINAAYYKYYGARGIKVCERWEKFENFINDMGEKPTPVHTLDRIDNDGDYAPSNCVWATRKEQAQNRRPSKPLITFNGKTQSLKDWARDLGVRPGLLYERRGDGWSIERVLSPKKQ